MKTLKFWLHTYDVWGNPEDGFWVNDRHMRQAVITIRCKDSPTNRQLSRAIGIRGAEWSGEDDYTLYATDKNSGEPLCELERINDCD